MPGPGASAGDDVQRTCVNGHPLRASANFCPTCGVATAGSASGGRPGGTARGWTIALAIVAVLAVAVGGTLYVRARLTRPPASPAGAHGAVTPSAPATYDASPSRPSAELARTATAAASATAPDATDAAGTRVAYVAANVLDGDPATAWRAPGDGSGVTLTVAFPRRVRLRMVGMIPGYDKTDPVTGVRRWSQNRRITAARWHFDDGTVVAQRFADAPVMQRIPVDATAASVVVEVVSTMAGDGTHDYTAVSDVSLVGS
jgi:hypothetical protein